MLHLLRDGYRIHRVTNTIDTPPFEAYAVSCGITFTFGGVRIDTVARVISTEGEPVRGLYSAGEIVDGLIYFNYPGGIGERRRTSESGH